MRDQPAGPRPERNPSHVRRPDATGRRSLSARWVALGGTVAVLVLAFATGLLRLPGGPAVGAGSSPIDGSPVAYAAGPSSSVGAGSPGASSPGVPATGSPAPASTSSAAPASAAPATPGATTGPGEDASPTPAPVPARRLQAKLDRIRAGASLPGVSVAMVWDDGRTWTGVSGSADVARGVPLTPDSGFALASISKTFTAAVVLQLVDEGRLQLDQAVAPLLPSYRMSRRITVRMLLDHTSGLPDFFFNRTIDARLQGAPNATWTAQDSWSLVARKRPRPGTVWAYSNTNYLLLGELVQAVTGRPLATEIRHRLLNPLKLSNTWYQAVEKPRTSTTRGYRLLPASDGGVRAAAVARASSVMPFRSVVTAAGGAGSIASTALDTARWMQAFAGGQVLSPAMQAAMLADVATTSRLHPRIPYGLGIQEVTILGRTALGHSGRYLGYRNVVRYLPQAGVTIAVLTNQGVYDPARIAKALLRIVLAPAPGASQTAAEPSVRP